ncbi:Glucose-repressible alcohol dehydrogenase transcriptional effector [Irineochytrium annulatum]|nr:Glucose-repressible alcohol dehydrogenase transcriptional effector [Irineochytrium annulatum]
MRISSVYQPDILVLQEMDRLHWDEALCEHVASMGYEHVVSWRKDAGGHGLVVLFRPERHRLTGVRMITFDGHPKSHPTNIVPVTNNQAFVVALEKVEGGEAVANMIVSNCHLYWRPDTEFTKLRQVYILMEEIESLKKQLLAGAPDKQYRVFACGGKLFMIAGSSSDDASPPDFNITPDSAIYRKLTSRTLTPEDIRLIHPSPYELGLERDANAESLEGIAPPASPVLPTIEEKLTVDGMLTALGDITRLESAYARYQAMDSNHVPGWERSVWEGEPFYTNFGVYRGTLDYIMHEPGPVRLRAITALMAKEELEPGLPNAHFPSDHLPLIAAFDA